MTQKSKKKQNVPSADDLVKVYRKMYLVRKTEEKIANLYLRGLVGGFCHLYIGQEAVFGGIYLAARPTDQIITSYRAHAFMLLRQDDPTSVIAELLGRKIGCSEGKGGSMHVFDPDRGFYGGHGIVGAQVSLGTGIAFANRYRSTDHLCLTLMGDGAVNQGQVYESFNLAALWRLPVIYIIENNRYGMGSVVDRVSASSELYRRGESFGIEGFVVDGMDVLQVYATLSHLISCCREDPRPYILEVKTYRYKGHSMSDPGQYRTREEIDEYRKNRDPIMQLKNYLLEHHLLEESTIKAVHQEVMERVDHAEEVAMKAPLPSSNDLYTDIYRHPS